MTLASINNMRAITPNAMLWFYNYALCLVVRNIHTKFGVY